MCLYQVVELVCFFFFSFFFCSYGWTTSFCLFIFLVLRIQPSAQQVPSNQGLHHWAKPQPLLFSKGLRGPRVDFTLVAHWRQSSKNLKALVWLVGWLWAPHSTYALWSFTGKVMHLPLPNTWKLGYITDLVWLRAALYLKVNSISL